MKKRYTDITIVLDRSGSMESRKHDVIGGLNQFLKEQQQVKGEATITLIQFDHEYSKVYEGINIQHAPLLNTVTYFPRGSTALLDAIGKAIHETGNRLNRLREEDKPDKVIFVIQTDGEENSSSEFNRAKIYEMIGHQRGVYKWEFVFLGANQDAIAEAKRLNICTDASMTYANNSHGLSCGYASLSQSVTKVREGKNEWVAFSEEDRKKQGESEKEGEVE